MKTGGDPVIETPSSVASILTPCASSSVAVAAFSDVGVVFPVESNWRLGPLPASAFFSSARTWSAAGSFAGRSVHPKAIVRKIAVLRMRCVLLRSAMVSGYR